jgi:hypothetical protein
VVAVWESRDVFEAFRDARVVPAVKAVFGGEDPAPSPME